MATPLSVFKYQIARQIENDGHMIMDPSYVQALNILADGAQGGLPDLLRAFSDDEFISWAMTVAGGNPKAVQKVFGMSLDEFRESWKRVQGYRPVASSAA